MGRQHSRRLRPPECGGRAPLTIDRPIERDIGTIAPRQDRLRIFGRRCGVNAFVFVVIEPAQPSLKFSRQNRSKRPDTFDRVERPGTACSQLAERPSPGPEGSTKRLTISDDLQAMRATVA